MLLQAKKRVLIGLFSSLIGCGSEDATQVAGAPPEGSAGTGPEGSAGAPGLAEPPPCVENPTTHLEIINACTDAVKIRKTPSLTLLGADGSLPPP